MELTTPGRVLGGRYRLVEPLARGGMATVWVADDPVLSRRVAVKVLRADLAADDATRARFRNEAIAAARLSHPNIVSTYDTGDDEGIAYIVMELVDGPTLRHLIDEHNGLPVADVIRIGKQVADALDAAHRAGIVHRDVKPANLLVTPDRRIKITDFGIARASDGLGLTATGQVMGTPQYLSPEQARGGTATPASDVYSLGVVAFECLAGHRPFDADSPVATALAHLNDPVPDLPPNVPADLAAVVRRAMAKEPEHRYADGDAFAAALRSPSAEAATAYVPPVVPPPSTQATQVMAPVPPVDPTPTAMTDGRSASADRRRTWLVVLLTIAVVAAIVLVAVLIAKAAGGGDEPTATDTTSAPTTSAPTTETTATEETTSAPAEVQINEDDYLGRNVDVVAAELRRKGLEVDTEPVDNPGDQKADTVANVSPTTGLSVGDTVTVEYYREAEPTSEPPTTEPTTPSDTPTTPATSPTSPSAAGGQTASESPPAAGTPPSRPPSASGSAPPGGTA